MLGLKLNHISRSGPWCHCNEEFFHNVHLPIFSFYPLQWRHNERDGVSNHQPHDCLLNRLFRRRSKKTSKLWVTGLCEANSPVTGDFPAQTASNAENVSIWLLHHAICGQIRSCELRKQIYWSFSKHTFFCVAHYLESAQGALRNYVVKPLNKLQLK